MVSSPVKGLLVLKTLKLTLTLTLTLTVTLTLTLALTRDPDPSQNSGFTVLSLLFVIYIFTTRCHQNSMRVSSC